MKDLETDQLIQLINFYRQKSSDLELEALILQVKLNKIKNNQQSEPMLDL